MSKQRIIKDEMWNDEWFFELDPSEKLMWVFLLTNPRNNIAGVFSCSIAWVGIHTGFEKGVVELILGRFEKEGKIIKKDKWIILVNFAKHQAVNPKVEAGIKRILSDLPKPIYSLYIAYPSSVKLSRVELSEVELSKVELEVDFSVFEDFWQEYPVKKEKKKTREKFMKLTVEIQKTIIEDVKNRKAQDSQWRQGYVPHPTTYLNGERWEDEIDNRNLGDKKDKSVSMV